MLDYNSSNKTALPLKEKIDSPDSERYGLVIGIENYKDNWLAQSNASADAQKIYNLMIKPDCGFFPEKNASLLVNENATQRNIKRDFSRLKREITENDTLWIYYSGLVGYEDDYTYWLPYDAELDDLYVTGLPVHEIKNLISRMSAKEKLLFLDFCYPKEKVLQDNFNGVPPSKKELLSQHKANEAVILASTDNKDKSLELKNYQHSAQCLCLLFIKRAQRRSRFRSRWYS